MTKSAREYLFTVISTCYNVAPWINVFFESLSNQTLDFAKYIQLILVDDGSTDDSAELMREFSAKYPDNVLCLHKENGGSASARNYGLPHAQGRWITFTGADDFIADDYNVDTA